MLNSELTLGPARRWAELLRARIAGEMGHLESSLLKVNPRNQSGQTGDYTFNMADAGTDSMEREISFDIASKEGRLLREIDDAAPDEAEERARADAKLYEAQRDESERHLKEDRWIERIDSIVEVTWLMIKCAALGLVAGGIGALVHHWITK